MKRKLLSVLLVLVLALSLSLVTAVPVGAATGPQFLDVVPVGVTTGEWSTTVEATTPQAGTYSYHVVLPADAAEAGLDIIHKYIYGPTGVGTMTLPDITEMTFWEYVKVAGGTDDLGAGITLYMDMNADGDFDWVNDAQIVLESPYNSPLVTEHIDEWALRDITDFAGFQKGGGALNAEYTGVDGVALHSTLAEWQASGYAEYVVLWVGIVAGWGDYGSYDGYFDDFIINGETYVLEPRVINANTSEGFSTIQAAIDDASPGDTISVAAGTYNEDITLKNEVQVLGAGEASTTINGTGTGSVVTASGVGPTTKLDGFTITGGSSTTYGGGMHIYNNSSPTVSNCTFSGNSAAWGGGGMCNEDSSPTVTNCTFFDNSTAFSGGGMANRGSLSTPTVTNCTFFGNSAHSGGGLSNYWALATVTNCTFYSNTGQDGGGMYNSSSSSEVTNCIFYGNTTTSDGGGMYNRDSSPTVTNCTFSGNSAYYDGGAMCSRYNCTATVINCILWGDSINPWGEGPEIYDWDYPPASVTTVTYSDVQGGWVGTGNKNIYPRFADAAAGDYHLEFGSPCIDAGNSAAVPSGVTTDFEGDPRIMGAAVDMGADEFLPHEVWVDDDFTEATPGWGLTHFAAIQPAIDAVAESGMVNVAAGTYSEQVEINDSLTLQGAGDTTIIQPSGAGVLTTVKTTPWIGTTKQMAAIVFVDTATTVTVTDLKIDGSLITEVPAGVGGDWVAGLAYLETGGIIDSLTVVGNPNLGCRAAGIWASAIAEETIVEATGCNVIGYNRAGIYALGGTITVDYHHNEINGPGAEYLGPQVPNGIFFLEGVNGSATYNTVNDLSYTGVGEYRSTGIGTYNAGSDVTFAYNTISNVQNAFALSTGTVGTIVEYNDIFNNHTGVRIEASAASSIIRYNDIHDNDFAIRCGATMGDGNEAHYNNIVNNPGVLWVNEDEADPNTYVGAVCNVHPTFILDATNNWWGHDTGPQHATLNPEGQGNAVSDNVSFDPWLPKWYPTEPLVVTDAASSLGTTSATLNGSLDDLGSALSVEVSFEWGTTTAYGTPVLVVTPLSEAGVFSATLSGLSDDTTYHFRVKAVGDGPDVYGDDITFTTKRVTAPTPPTYYTETSLFGTEASFPISSSGKILETIEATSADGNLTITIPKDTVALDKDGKRLASLEAAVDESPPDPPADANIIGLAYDFGPDGATFDPAITLEYTYDPDALPEGVAEEDLVLAYYDEAIGEWVELDCVVDTVNNTITASIAHFTTFAIIGTEEEEVAPPPAPAAFTVSSLGVSPSELAPSEEVNISVLVSNIGGKSGSYSVVLKINGVKEQEERVTITAGSSQTVTFSVTKEEADSYTVTVDGLSGSFTVAPVVVPPEPAAFSVSFLSVSPEVEPAETITITVFVANTGGESGSYTVVLKIDGVKEAEETVTVAAGDSQEVSFSVTREEAGSYTVDVDGLSGSFTVVLPIKPPGINWPLIGGIIGGVIVAGLLYYFLVFRRRAY